jgi:peptidoglycan/LPS O-acetylase OafA/YrhL
MYAEGSATAQDSCSRCGRSLAGRSGFLLGGNLLCTRCSLRFRPMLWRSFLTAVVVGTVLIAINQGTVLLDGSFPASLYWKIPLTYAVPFCVASWGALINSRRTEHWMPP